MNTMKATAMPVSESLADRAKRIREGDVVAVEHAAGDHVRSTRFRVDTKSTHVVSGVRVHRKTGAPVFRNGGPLRGSASVWKAIVIEAGPQTLDEAYAEHAERSP